MKSGGSESYLESGRNCSSGVTVNKRQLPPRGAIDEDRIVGYVPQAAHWLDSTEKAVRQHKVSRRQIPFHRMGRRIFFVKSEVLDYLRRLPGVSVDEAIETIEAR